MSAHARTRRVWLRLVAFTVARSFHERTPYADGLTSLNDTAGRRAGSDLMAAGSIGRRLDLAGVPSHGGASPREGTRLPCVHVRDKGPLSLHR